MSHPTAENDARAPGGRGPPPDSEELRAQLQFTKRLLRLFGGGFILISMVGMYFLSQDDPGSLVRAGQSYAVAGAIATAIGVVYYVLWGKKRYTRMGWLKSKP